MHSTRPFAGVEKDGHPRLSWNYAWLRGWKYQEVDRFTSSRSLQVVVSPALSTLLVAILENFKVIMKAQTSTFKYNLEKFQGLS